jgi:hypothetical protein
MQLIQALYAHYKVIRRKRAFPEDLSPNGWTLLRLMLSQPDIINPKLKGSVLDLPCPVSFDKTSAGYAAAVPELPGCVATGRTIQETLRNIKNALSHHASSSACR